MNRRQKRILRYCASVLAEEEAPFLLGASVHSGQETVWEFHRLVLNKESDIQRW